MNQLYGYIRETSSAQYELPCLATSHVLGRTNGIWWRRGTQHVDSGGEQITHVNAVTVQTRDEDEEGLQSLLSLSLCVCGSSQISQI